MMRFIQITDTHIGPSPAFRLYGRDPCANLVELVKRINALTFDVDFILHNGDITDDGDPGSYRLFKQHMDRVRFPVRYTIGNHDQLEPLRDILLGGGCGHPPRFDQQFEYGGVEFAVFDTRGPTPPGGHLYDDQLQRLADLCAQPAERPLVIVVHHQPVDLDTPWLDRGGKSWPAGKYMRLDNGDAFLRTIARAGPQGSSRLRGVFFGHVHTSFQIHRDGVFFCSGPSAFAQLTTAPDCTDVALADEVSVGFNIITIDGAQTLVRSVRYPAV